MWLHIARNDFISFTNIYTAAAYLSAAEVYIMLEKS